MTVAKYTAIYPMTEETMEDSASPHLAEYMDIWLFGTKPEERYHAVWGRGYWAALEDIRSGRLRLVDGFFVGDL